MEVNVHEAKTHLSKLISAAESGQEVVIARAGKPAVRLVAFTAAPPKSRKDMIGAGIGKLWIADDFDSLETDLAIQRMFEGESGDDL